MNRPVRTHMSIQNFPLLGIPKSFYSKDINDFETFGSQDLMHVKAFIEKYLSDMTFDFVHNKGIYLYGSNGVGKSVIACLIVKEAYRHRFTTHRVTFADYITAYTRVWGAKSAEDKDSLNDEFYNRYKSVEFLVIEEVGKEIDSKVAAPILEDCLRYREEQGLPTIVCTNLDLKEVTERYGMSVFSLMKGNMTPVCIEGKDKRAEMFKER